MPGTKRAGDLEVAQDLDFQRRAWAVQRAGWVVMAVVLVLALLGLFGQGILSQVQTGSGGLNVQYERFARLEGPTTMRVEIGPGSVPGDTFRLALDRQYVEDINIQRIQPEPDTTEIGGDFVTYSFQVSDPDGPASVTIRYAPERAGLLRGWLRLNDGPPSGFSQFVYP